MNMKRQRGRNGGGGGGKPHPHMPVRSQTFDSSGPDVRIRGNAYQVLEKYLALARDATAAGDRIAAENFYQHAEHYYRTINANNDGRPHNPMYGQDPRFAQQQPQQQHYQQQPQQPDMGQQPQHQQHSDPGAGPQPIVTMGTGPTGREN
jgi:hypothetical protein